jgi:3-oxoacyl-[acyl-carrier protein] reductase
MDLGLKGRRALVMGASRGLGRGIARGLAAEGAELVLAARSLDKLEADAAALRAAHGVAVEARRLALGQAGAVEALAEGLGDRGVDILIANTGGPPPSGALGVAPDTWRRQFEQMVLPVIALADALVPAMRRRRWGRVVLIASSGVVQPIPTLAMSNTLRSSLVGFCKTLAGEVAGDGVTVNVMLPGRITTERTGELDAATAERRGVSFEEARKEAASTIPAGRYGEVDEFAAVAVFLASARAGYVTGSVVRVDGGLIRSV